MMKGYADPYHGRQVYIARFYATYSTMLLLYSKYLYTDIMYPDIYIPCCNSQFHVIHIRFNFGCILKCTVPVYLTD